MKVSGRMVSETRVAISDTQLTKFYRGNLRRKQDGAVCQRADVFGQGK